MNRKKTASAVVWRGVTHAMLLAGSILFAAPFIWLLSTSSKVNDELYPPKWIPQIPRGVIESPYIDVRDNERPLKPVLVSVEDWQRLFLPVCDAISGAIEGYRDEFPEFYGPFLTNRVWAEAVFARLLRRAPDVVFTKMNSEATAWFVENTTPKLCREVFDTVYRRVALSDVVLHGWDLSIERPTAGANFSWRVVDGDAVVVSRPEGLDRPGQEVRYSFAKRGSFRVETILPTAMRLEDLKRVVVSNHCDRSWHTLWATVEMEGRKFVSAQSAFSGTDLWQETTWQFASEDDDSIKMKTWLRLEAAGVSEFVEPGKIRVTVEYRYAPRIFATFNKYTDNYRKALRIAPMTLYVRNSVLLVLLNVVGQVLGSSLVAFSFARLRWPGRDACFFLVLATMMIPPQVTMIPVFLIFKELGWYNSLKPLWVTSFFGGAFNIFLLRQFMLGIPRDLEDSAKIDGCSYFRIYRSIVLPLIKPALATIGIFTFLYVWNDFMGPLVYLTDQRLYPLSLGLFALQALQGGAFSYGLMMSASVMMTVPVILLFFSAQRTFIQGVTLSGLKG
ncbi:MAG: ABC transporter permease subunit [Candidatus Hydrogenedentes bacterium]|nr:ABC transporter permease subunit [Candidatus Hydrogenedentota bacterium]